MLILVFTLTISKEICPSDRTEQNLMYLVFPWIEIIVHVSIFWSLNIWVNICSWNVGY